jgi:hypothetical protein
MISIVAELVSSLGLGGQIATAASIGAIGWYLWRAGALAGIVLSVLGSIRLIAIGVAVLLAVGVGLGWIDLSVGAIVGDVSRAVGGVVEIVAGGLAGS